MSAPADIAVEAAKLRGAMSNVYGAEAATLGEVRKAVELVEQLARWLSENVHVLELIPVGDPLPGCQRLTGRCSCGGWQSDYDVWSDNRGELGGMWVAFESHLLEARPTAR